MKKILAATLVVSLSALSANAADMGYGAYDVDGYDWNGFYGGVMAGYGKGKTKLVATDIVNVIYNDSVNTTGGVLGATVGYNVLDDTFLWGVEGDVMWSGISGESCFTFCKSINIDWLATVRARAGIVDGDALYFATLGLAAAGVELFRKPPVAGPTDGQQTNTHYGWTAGFGAEYAVSDNSTLKFEYAHIDLGSKNIPFGGVSNNLKYKVSPKIDMIKVGWNMKFE